MDTIRDQQAPDVSGSPSGGLFATTAGFFFGFAAVSLYGPTATFFQESMGLTPTMVGILVAVPALSGSLLRVPFGAWVESTGGKKPFSILLLASVVGLGGVFAILALYYPDGMHDGLYPAILFFGFLSGCGIATFSVGIGQTSYWFPVEKQGTALGMFAGFGNIAPGLFSLILPVILLRFDVISAYFAWWLMLVVGTIMYITLAHDAPYFQFRREGVEPVAARVMATRVGQELFPTGTPLESLKRSAGNTNTWFLVAIYFSTFGGFIALTAWYPTFWNQLYGLSPVRAGLLTAVYSILASVIRVYGGKLADLKGGEAVAVASIVMVLVGAIAISVVQSYVWAIVATVLLAVGMGVANGAVFKMVPAYVSDAVGGAAGWVGGLGAFGGFVLPPLMGQLVNAFGESGYRLGFLIFVLLAVIDLALVVILLRRKNMLD